MTDDTDIEYVTDEYGHRHPITAAERIARKLHALPRVDSQGRPLDAGQPDPGLIPIVGTATPASPTPTMPV